VQSQSSYPKIANVNDCKEAIIRLLETDWGKWRPRTMEELKEAMDASDLKYSVTVLNLNLKDLTDKGIIRRWNTNTGFVYILAEDKPLSIRGEA
jgi:DNA-binding HxlR family transcriptional regulator